MKKKIFLMALFFACFLADSFCLDADKFMQVLSEAKNNFSGTFSSIDQDLSAAARGISIAGIKSDEARQVLNSLCKGRSYAVDCAIVDEAGKMTVVEPQEYNKFEGSDISMQAQVKRMLKDKKPVFSDVFTSVEGIKTVDVEYPIFSGSNEFLGSVSMLIDQEVMAEIIIAPLVRKTHCKIWIMQKNGLIVYDPDPNQIGRNIFSDELFRDFNVLISFCRTVANTKEGAGSYDFYASSLGDKVVVSKYAAWDTVSLYGNEWRIVVMEADKPKSTVPGPDLKHDE